MNLPRHTLTSHALSPTFVNAQFHNIKQRTTHLHQEGEQRAGDGQSNNVRLHDKGEGSSREGSSYKTDEGEKESSAVEDAISSSMFACATRQGYFIARTNPLQIVARRGEPDLLVLKYLPQLLIDNHFSDFPSNQGGLSHVSLVDDSSLLVLVGGGRVPRFAPNKVILWDEDATRIVSVQKSDAADTSSSEGTASPLASTLFSLGREQDEEVGEMSNSRDTESLPSASQIMNQNAIYSTGGEDDDDALMRSTKSMAADYTDEHQERPSSSVEKGKASTSASMSSSAYVEDPFGAPALEAKKPEPSPPASKSRLSSQSTSLPSVSHVIRKGREVAELEFGEAVKGICVRTFEVGERTKQGSKSQLITSATLLVVILNTKAVVFELGRHITLEQQISDDDGNVDKSRWGLRQRIVVEIRPGLEKGMASMSSIQNSNCILLALPGRQTGHVQLLSIALSNTSRTSIRSSIAGASTIIAAHANAISSLTLSDNGKLLCTTSERGTILRVWSTLSASSQDKNVMSLSTSLVGELRRGSDAAKIWSVSFSPDSLLLAAGSDKGTIHFFNLNPLHQVMSPLQSPLPKASLPSNNLSKKANKYLPPSVQQFAGSIPPSLLPQYLKSQWSFAQFKIPLKVFSSSIAEGSRSSPMPLYSMKGQQRNGGYEGGIEEGNATGKQISLEGGWAGMRGRIDDVRKGEKGIEEGMWLTWIPSSHSEQKDSTTSKSTKSIKRRSDQTSHFELVAITSSGSHYRIGVAAPDQGLLKIPKTTTVLDMYKEDGGNQQSTMPNNEENSNNKDDHTEQCWLLEYQRFGMRDEWID